MGTLLIVNGRVVDPDRQIDQIANILIHDGVIAELTNATPAADQTIDAAGRIVTPGWIDLHVGVRDPGFEEDETTDTATAAALAGGFTAIAALPDTSPVVDNRSAAEYVVLQAKRSNRSRVYPLGAITRGHGGEELSDMGQLVDGGAVGFTDAKTPVRSAEVMRRALEYARMFDRPILSHVQDPTLIAGGVMHEGFYSTKLGLRGMPAAAESIFVTRDAALAELTGGRIHMMSISTDAAVSHIRWVKKRGVRVTCDVTPHHITLTDSLLESYNSNFKVTPPLRNQRHIDALIEGLRDGTIDAISSDHQPSAFEKKCRELDLAPFGIIGLETLLPICHRTLIEPGHLSWLQFIEKVSTNPAHILGVAGGTLAPGSPADVTILDPDREWVIDPNQFRSKSRNSPFAGETVRGKVTNIILAGLPRSI